MIVFRGGTKARVKERRLCGIGVAQFQSAIGVVTRQLAVVEMKCEALPEEQLTPSVNSIIILSYAQLTNSLTHIPSRDACGRIRGFRVECYRQVEAFQRPLVVPVRNLAKRPTHASAVLTRME